MAGCARLHVFYPGERLLREGEPADEFFLIRRGAVAIETEVPGRGAVTLETLEPGEILGWSWLVPPYRSAFGARALDAVHVIVLDGACLRGKCERDPALGYALLGRRLGWPELRWVAYTLVVLGGAKLVLQDLPAGRPATLVPSLALYGLALLLAPRLLRPAGPA